MGFHSHLRRWSVGAVLAASAGVLAWDHGAHPRVLHQGDRLVNLPVVSLNGTSTEARTPGRAQLINVFATWCPPCRQELPAIKQLAIELKARDVDVVGVDQQEPAATVQRFARSFHLPFAVYIDDTNITHDRLGARIIPTTILVDPQGVIRWERSGPLTAEDLHSLGAVVASVQ